MSSCATQYKTQIYIYIYVSKPLIYIYIHIYKYKGVPYIIHTCMRSVSSLYVTSYVLNIMHTLYMYIYPQCSLHYCLYRVPHMIRSCMRFVTLRDYTWHYMLRNFLHDYVSTLDQPAEEENLLAVRVFLQLRPIFYFYES